MCTALIGDTACNIPGIYEIIWPQDRGSLEHGNPGRRARLMRLT
jgi:hypothetical protein